MTAITDTDDLTPAQYLVIELLAARYRLGHNAWTVTYKVRRQLQALERLGLIGYKSAPVENAYLAWLTDDGKAVTLMPGYVSPLERRLDPSYES